MSDPQGSDRIQQDIPTAAGTGDNSSTGGSGSSFDEVPLTTGEAIERDDAQGDDLPRGIPLHRHHPRVCQFFGTEPPGPRVRFDSPALSRYPSTCRPAPSSWSAAGFLLHP